MYVLAVIYDDDDDNNDDVQYLVLGDLPAAARQRKSIGSHWTRSV